MGIANWKVWGHLFYYAGYQAWGQIFQDGVQIYNLPTNNSKLYFVIVLIVALLVNIYTYFLQYYMSILMWSASIAVLSIIQQADHLFGREGCFNLKKVYRQNV
jgi:hypothetical protein